MTQTQTVEAFEQLLGYCTGYGGGYKPGNGNLQLKAMRALLEKAQSSLHNVSVAKAHLDKIINERRDAFADMHQRVRSMIAFMEAVGVNEQALADTRFYSRQIFGKRAGNRKPVQSESTEEVKRSRTATQTSYANQASHFSNLVLLAQMEPLYKPNEEKLAVESLKHLADRLHALNDNVAQAQVDVSNARINKDGILFKQAQALYTTAMAVKKYVKAVFGYSSDQYRQVVRLKFTKMRT